MNQETATPRGSRYCPRHKLQSPEEGGFRMTIPRNNNGFNRKSLSREATPASIVLPPQKASRFTQMGKRLLFSYLTSLLPSNLFMVNGILVCSSRMLVAVIHGGLLL